MEPNFYGQAERILKFEDRSIVVNEQVIRKMFEHPDVKNRKIVAFSVIGAFRKGKSFFLDYCLRYLYANYKSINYKDNPLENSNEWIGEKDEPLNGFSWRAGTDRDTMGLVVWNDVFLYTDKQTEEEFAIVIVDTQGLFDNGTTADNNKRIFALGTLISSIQVLNLSGVIQEDQLQYLHFATEFAKFTMQDRTNDANKPFQNLVFLVRDWENNDEFAFGQNGGENYLKKVLKIDKTQKGELKLVRQFIYSSFENLTCFLLPYPGKFVTGVKKLNNTQYDGNWGSMDEDFKTEFFDVIEYLLKSENLMSKKVNDVHLNGSNYLDYLLTYFKLFQSNHLPETKTIYEAEVERQFNLLVSSCIEVYNTSLKSKENSIETLDDIPKIHAASIEDALAVFKDSKKMGNVEHEQKYRKVLVDQIDKIYNAWKDQTETNVKRIEEEKQRTLLAEKEKQQLLLEKHKLEQDALMQTFQMEKMKQEFEMQKVMLKNENEMEKLKFEAEKEREKIQKKHDIEKLKLEKDIEHEKLSKESEITKHKLQNEHILKMAEQDVMIERIRSDTEQNAENQATKARLFELEKSLDQEKLQYQMTAAELVRKAEQEQQALKMTTELEKLKIESEKQNELREKDKEILKAEHRANERIYEERSAMMQQQNLAMAQKLETAEQEINELNKRDDDNSDKVLEFATTLVQSVAPMTGGLIKGLLKQNRRK